MGTKEINPKLTLGQVLCASVDGCGALSMAALLGYTSSGLLQMTNDPDFEITEEQGSWVGAIVPGMALLGSLVAGKLLNAFGRRKVSMVTSIPAICAWICVALSTSAYHVIGARCIGGLCLGIHQVTVSIYVSETVHPKLKPIVSIIPGLCALAGFLFINLAGESIGWRGMGWLGMSFSIPLLLIILMLPETPYYLLKSNRKAESLRTIAWLRSDQKEAQKEFNELEQTISSEKRKSQISFQDIFQPPYRWSVCMALLLHIFQQMTGVSAIASFFGLIMERSGSSISTSVGSIIMTVVNLASIFIAGKALSKYPRKIFMKNSSMIIIVTSLIFSAYLWARESKSVFHDLANHLTYIPVLVLTIYFFGFGVGWGPIPWMFISEGIPVKIRGQTAGIVIATNWAFNFLITKSYSWITLSFGTYSVYLMYAGFTLFSLIITETYLPETFGMSDLQLESYYRESYKIKRK